LKTEHRAILILILLLKTGMRAGELCSLDISDVSLERREVVLKPTAKRSNRLLFFDQEMARVLQSWLVTRKHLRASGQGAFFPSKWSTRPHLNHGTITWIVSGCAERVRRPWCWLVLDWQLTGISAPPMIPQGLTICPSFVVTHPGGMLTP
jgi:integrase